MRVLVTGVSGQVGGALVAASPRDGWILLPVDRQALDLADGAAVIRTVERFEPDIVVNPAAYTAVDKAESEPGRAFAVNAEGAGALARACRTCGIPLIHLSTDYVFDGAKRGAYLPGDPVNPLNVYGASKEVGERAVRDALPEHLILRTSWVYSARGNNFLRTMLRLAGERDTLRIVADQHGSPTSAEDIATALMMLLARFAAGERLKWGTWHFTNAGVTTWHGFAEAIFELAAPSLPRRPRIVPITTADYPTPARRPLNSVLDCSSLERNFGIKPRSWQEALESVISESVASGRNAAPS